ncbi:MAG: hypothetical protein ACK4RV_10410 [Caulobacter sp.]
MSVQLTALLEQSTPGPFPRCRDTDEAYCPVCGEPDPEPSVEAFEVFDAVCCIECGEAMFANQTDEPDQ